MRHLASDPQRLLRWTVTLALAAFAVALQWSVRPWVGTQIPFLFFLPVIVVAASRGGRSAGMFVVATGFVSAVRWLTPEGALWVSGVKDVVSLAVYALLGTLLATLGARLRVSSARASEAEQRLVLASEDTGIGIFDLDLDTSALYLSPALAALTGVDTSAGASSFEALMARLPPAFAQETRELLARKIGERARTYEREVRLPRPGGGASWLMLRVNIVWAGERPLRLRGACIDITERKAVDALLDRTKAELSQQVADLKRLHDLSSRLLETTSLPEQLQMILVALAEFHDASRGVVALLAPGAEPPTVDADLGFSRPTLQRMRQARGAGGASLLADARRERTVIADTEDLSDTGVDPALRTLARQEGFRAVHRTPLIGPHGDVLGTISIHFETPREPGERERTLADICARKAAIFVERARAQAALAESQGHFQAVLDASAVPFVVLAPVREPASGRVVDFEWDYVNAAAARALHRPPADFVGRRVLEVLPGRWSDRDPVSFRQYVAIVDDEETREFETRVVYEGRDQWFHCVGSPMRGSVALWFTDVTSRKRDEQTLQEADRRKDEFLATLAHELRNPLAPIRQAAAISRLPQATDAQKLWSHGVIERQVRHMALLLDDLLDVSRITRGALVLRRGDHVLGDMLEAAVETARPLVDARHHQLEIVVPKTPVRLQADPLRVSQIVANLLTNAAKYTDPHGHLRLVAALDGDDVVIEVGDNGIGIAAESLPSVFDMFTQLRSQEDRAGGGLGIGLALTKGLVELHGGAIAVRSDGPGLGSVFTVRLPRGAPPARAAARPHDLEPRATPARRILIADDNRDAAESLGALLELEGHQVTLAFDGDDALRAYDRVRPEVCLLDIGMPHRTGNEVASTIRAGADGAAATLVAITGWGQESDRQQALAAGFDHHLTKPVDPAQLMHLIAGPHAGERSSSIA